MYKRERKKQLLKDVNALVNKQSVNKAKPWLSEK